MLKNKRAEKNKERECLSAKERTCQGQDSRTETYAAKAPDFSIHFFDLFRPYRLQEQELVAQIVLVGM